MNKLESKILAEKMAKLIYEKKGSDIAIVDLQGISILTDFFVIANGTSRPHNRAIANHVNQEVKSEIDQKLKHIQGKTDGGWIVMDYGTVIVHIFLDNLRSYYNLEGLWKEAEITHPEFIPVEIDEKKEEFV